MRRDLAEIRLFSLEQLADRYAERIGQLDQSTQPQILFSTLNGTRKGARKAAFVRQVFLGPLSLGAQGSDPLAEGFSDRNRVLHAPTIEVLPIIAPRSMIGRSIVGNSMVKCCCISLLCSGLMNNGNPAERCSPYQRSCRL